MNLVQGGQKQFIIGQGRVAIVNTTYSQNVSKIPKNVLAKDETIRTPLLRPLVIGSYISRNIRFAMPIETICIIHRCNMHSIHIHIWSESNLVNFWTPNIPKADLRSSWIVESDDTLGISRSSNVPIFILIYNSKEVACRVHILKVSVSNPG